MVYSVILCKTFLVIFYFIISVPIFNQIYITSKEVIDEEFHLRQGKHYCDGNFTVWDPKITTLPGLYIYSTLLLAIFKGCSTYYLRLTSLIASCLNVYLIFEIRDFHNHNIQSKLNSAYSALETLTISLLPPMYFFVNLYYTDVVSITMVLAMMLFSLKNQHKTASIFGFFSVLMRQTNILWVGLIFAHNLLDKIMHESMHLINKTKVSHHHLIHYDLYDIFVVIKRHLQQPYFLKNTFEIVISNFIGYIFVLLSFLTFIYVNGSLVVGDKTAHVAALHVPQLFYFSLFFTLFGISTTLSNISKIIKLLINNWYIVISLGILIIIIVKVNTIIHPYLLADNRHYTFYIWNRFYGNYAFAKYIMIPFYLFSLANIWITLKSKSTGFIVFYILTVFLSTCLQQLLEIRYFILPFIILRLVKFKPKVNYLIIEFFTYLAINVFTFYIFFTKDIYWNDYNEPQKLIW